MGGGLWLGCVLGFRDLWSFPAVLTQQNPELRVGGACEGAVGCWRGSTTLKVPPRGAAVRRMLHPCCGGRAEGRGRGEGRWLWREGHCGAVGGPGAERGWALKVGAHSLGTAAATSTSWCFLCGSRISRSAAAHARVAARCLPRPLPPSQAVGCARLPAGLPCCGSCGARCSKPCAGRHGIRRGHGTPRSPPQVGACGRREGVWLAPSRRLGEGGCRLAGGDSVCPCQGCWTATPAVEGKPPPGVWGGGGSTCLPSEPYPLTWEGMSLLHAVEYGAGDLPDLIFMYPGIALMRLRIFRPLCRHGGI